MAGERDLEKSDAFQLCNLTFDESGYILLYGTMLGIKFVNLYTNRCVRVLGKPENLRILKIALFQVFNNYTILIILFIVLFILF